MKLFVCACVALTAAMLGSQPEGREVFRQRGVPIERLLQPGDNRVVVNGGPPPLGGFIPSFIPADQLLAGNARAADIVAIARIEERDPALSPDRSWIVTSVRARIVEAFKPSTLKRHDIVSFEQEGGVLEVNGVTIECLADWETQFKVGQDYLLFVRGANATPWVQWSYHISERKTLESLFPGFLEEDEADTGHGLPLSKVRLYLRGVR